MAKTYSYAGFSVSPQGQKKLRCSNDPEARAGTLKGHSDTDIEWHELPREMTRPEALEYMVSELGKEKTALVGEFRIRPIEQEISEELGIDSEPGF